MTWKLKGCPRCGGDIQLYEDMNHDRIENCLQCGYGTVSRRSGWQTEKSETAIRLKTKQLIRY